MPNSYFKFKQFMVHHDLCAMKVGTDGVLLGSWCDTNNASRALDIGTGTGLIALMIAQRKSDLKIEAIDIEPSAIRQAKVNISDSPFSDRIYCHHCALQKHAMQIYDKYDLIVSNPPFFIESLKSPDATRSMARHTDTLTPEELISISSKMLSDCGKLSMIYPYEQREKLIEIGKENSLFASRITCVRPTPESNPKRILIELSKNEACLIEDELIIEIERHVYSEQFKSLVKDFYLKM